MIHLFEQSAARLKDNLGDAAKMAKKSGSSKIDKEMLGKLVSFGEAAARNEHAFVRGLSATFDKGKPTTEQAAAVTGGGGGGGDGIIFVFVCLIKIKGEGSDEDADNTPQKMVKRRKKRRFFSLFFMICFERSKTFCEAAVDNWN